MAILPVSTNFTAYKSVKKSIAPKQQTSFGHRTYGSEKISSYPFVRAEIYYPTGAICAYTCTDDDGNEVRFEYNSESKQLKGYKKIPDGYNKNFDRTYKCEDITDQEKLKDYHHMCAKEAARYFHVTEQRARLDNKKNIG